MQEGVSSETCSLAGHLKLGNLIAIYDSNHVTVDGNTEMSFTEDVLKRYESYGWEILEIKMGNDDLDEISKAKHSNNKPTIINITTTIVFGSLQEGTAAVNGGPLKADDVKQLKKKFGFDPEKSFIVPQEVYKFYKKTVSDPGLEDNKK